MRHVEAAARDLVRRAFPTHLLVAANRLRATLDDLDLTRRCARAMPPEVPERIWWCLECSGGIGVWGVDSNTPPPCPECGTTNVAPIKFVPEALPPGAPSAPKPILKDWEPCAHADPCCQPCLGERGRARVERAQESS